MLDQHIFLNSMCTCIVTVVICFSDSNATVPPVPLVSLVSVVASVRYCYDNGACSASGALGVHCCFCEVLR